MTATITNERAAKVVHRHSLNPADRWELLRMLGLVDQYGNLLPDDLREYELEVNEVMGPQRIGQQTEHHMTMRPLASTAPETLKQLAPAPAPSKPARRPRHKPQRQPIKHNSDGGYRAHKRHGVPIPEDDSCGCRAAHKAARNRQRANDTEERRAARRAKDRARYHARQAEKKKEQGK